MQESDHLPAYVEETDEDRALLKDFVESDHFPVLRKKILNRIAERNQDLFSTKDLAYIDRMNELLSFLSELENVTHTEGV